MGLRVLLRGVEHEYPGADRPRCALSVRNLELAEGARLCVVGNSGAGKTTLLNVLAGLLTPTRGEVWVGDTEPHRLGEAARDRFRGRFIGCVFQTPRLLPTVSVLDNLTLSQHFAGQRAASDRRRAAELLQRLDLGHIADASPARLSLGEQQRVGIARALCKSPSLLLADEPTASLDDESAERAIELLRDASSQSTLIVVSHDPRLTERFEAVHSLGELATRSFRVEA